MSYCNHTKDESWWEYDARGIPLARVCDRCKAAKLKVYRPEVLTNPSYAADEDIEPGLDEGMAQGGDAYNDVMFGGLPDW